MANKVKLYIAPSYYNGDTLLGHSVDGDAEVEIVKLDVELPDLWDIHTADEATAAADRLREMLDAVQSIEFPNLEAEIDTEFLIDDILFEIGECEHIALSLARGALDYDDADPAVSMESDLVALAAESEREFDDLPRNLREAFEEMQERDSEF